MHIHTQYVRRVTSPDLVEGNFRCKLPKVLLTDSCVLLCADVDSYIIPSMQSSSVHLMFLAIYSNNLLLMTHYSGYVLHWDSWSMLP